MFSFQGTVNTTCLFFIGGNDVKTEGQYEWVNSEYLAPSLTWNPGEPNNHNDEEDCLSLLHHHHSLALNDRTCNRTGNFICQGTLSW